MDAHASAAAREPHVNYVSTTRDRDQFYASVFGTPEAQADTLRMIDNAGLLLKQSLDREFERLHEYLRENGTIPAIALLTARSRLDEALRLSVTPVAAAAKVLLENAHGKLRAAETDFTIHLDAGGTVDPGTLVYIDAHSISIPMGSSSARIAPVCMDPFAEPYNMSMAAGASAPAGAKKTANGRPRSASTGASSTTTKSALSSRP